MEQWNKSGITRSEFLRSSASGLLFSLVMVGFFVAMALHEPPTRSDLMEVRGKLVAYEFENHEMWVAVMSLTGRRDRFLTYAVTFATRPVPFHPGNEIRLFIRKPLGPATAETGVLRAYGLWVDGKTVQTLEADFDIDRRSNRDAVIMGAFFVGLVMFLWLRRWWELRPYPSRPNLS